MSKNTKLNICSAIILVIAIAGMIGLVHLTKHITYGDVTDIFYVLETIIMLYAGFYTIKFLLSDKIK